MENSLDDYIKFSENIKSTPECSTQSRKTVQVSAERKRECDSRALKIVEFSIEGKLRPEIFTRCLPYINQSHYQDIVEERAITKLCGYSICGKRIPDMPKKQYYISTKNNKVYDITERKNFCSNYCYKASLHIKKQIDDSPIWLRKLDDIPEYQLLSNEESGIPGEHIDQGISRPKIEASFTSVGNFTNVSLNDLIEDEKGRHKNFEKDKLTVKPKKASKLVKTMQTITENTEQIEEEVEEPQTYVENRSLQKSASLPVIIENEENIETKYESCENLSITANTSFKTENKKNKKRSTTKAIKTNPEDVLRKVIKEWLTLESFIFLYGETKMKEILNQKKLNEYFDKLHIDKLRQGQQIKYVDICRRLQIQEMADEKFDNTLLGLNKLKPLPDYNKLKHESKELNLKVKAFYSGILHEKDDPNFPSTTVKKEENSNNEESPVVLPLADINSQKSLRRKIFLNAVNKSMQQLLQALRINLLSRVLSDLQGLVKTFNLNADNIVFKPSVWNYISVILLNILSVRDSELKEILQEKSSQDYIKFQFSILPNQNGIIMEIMKEIVDVELFIETYISSN